LQRKTELLKSVELFSELDKKQINKLANLCVVKKYNKGYLLIKEGDVGLGTFIVTVGMAEVFKEVNGKKITIALVGPGNCIGELSLIDDAPRSANVNVFEDMECLLITKDSFNKLVRKNPEMALKIAFTMAKRLRTLTDEYIKFKQPSSVSVNKEKNIEVTMSTEERVEESTEEEKTGHFDKLMDIHDGVLSFFKNKLSSVKKHFHKDK